jgi:hypothetical protein
MSATLPGVLSIVDERLYALSNPFELDGRVTMFPVWARGFAPMNCYLLLEDTEALIVDTGFTVHEDALLEQIGSLIGDRRLSIYTTRFGELHAICNVSAIAEHFDVARLYAPWDEGTRFLDIRPDHNPPGNPILSRSLRRVEAVNARNGTVIEVGGNPQRRLRAFAPPLRLLATQWLHDAATGTLLTSDLFTHVWHSSAEGPWAATADADETTIDDVLACLHHSRYWWLPGANTQPIVDKLAEVFTAGAPIDAVGPGYGCVLLGREQVTRHHRLIQEALEISQGMTSSGVSIGRTYLTATDPRRRD